MFYKIKPTFENVSAKRHPDYVSRNTRVSEYLRKYGQGKIEDLPTDSRPQIDDPRSVDEMLSDEFVPTMATDELDVMNALEENSERFKAAFAEIELTKKQRVEFDNAIKVLEDKNSSYEAKSDAYRILEELEQKKKVVKKR